MKTTQTINKQTAPKQKNTNLNAVLNRYFWLEEKAQISHKQMQLY
jgi:hypothetical protein